jgi:hypothetical protein
MFREENPRYHPFKLFAAIVPLKMRLIKNLKSPTLQSNEFLLTRQILPKDFFAAFGE